MSKYIYHQFAALAVIVFIYLLVMDFSRIRGREQVGFATDTFPAGACIKLLRVTVSRGNYVNVINKSSLHCKDYNFLSTKTTPTDCEGLSIILFREADTQPVNFENVYSYFDTVIESYVNLQTKYRCAKIIWQQAGQHRQKQQDFRAVYDYLLKRYLKTIPGLDIMDDFKVEMKSDKQLLSYLRYNYKSSSLNAKELGRISLSNLENRSLLHLRCSSFLAHRKNNVDCFPQDNLEHYPLLVTGLGGAGTHYIARELCMVGFNFVHERIAADGSVVSYDDVFVVYRSYSNI
jgi:hypothetical protein